MTVTADAHNWIHTGSAPDYGYDAAGNMTSDPTDGVSMTYDAENLIAIATKDGIVTTYTCDAEGDRLRKDTATGSTEYVYFGESVIAEKNPSAGTSGQAVTGDWTDYIFANGKRIAQAFSYENRIRIYGTSTCTCCSGRWAYFAFPSKSGGVT